MNTPLPTLQPQSLDTIWVYLAASPLLGLSATLLAYLLAQQCFRRSGQHPLTNPVLLAVGVLVAFLSFTGIRYEQYFEGAQFVHFLLGPATVALAVPLYAQINRLRRMLLPVTLGLLAGCVTAIVSAALLSRWLGASVATQLSLAPKSATTPIAMGVAEHIGGIPALTAALVIITGIFGATMAPHLLNALRVRDPAIRGFATGVAAHGVGTARAFQDGPESGAFAALAMGLNGALTALLTPGLVAWLLAF